MKYPYPKQALKDKESVRKYAEKLTYNAMLWLNISGYNFWVLLPGDDGHYMDDESGLSIRVEYPYKKFKISIQPNTVAQALSAKTTGTFWDDFERSVFHEVIHVLLWQLEEIGRKRFTSSKEIEEANESVTDHLANIIYPMLRDRRKCKTCQK